jgi:hypothetical protein
MSASVTIQFTLKMREEGVGGRVRAYGSVYVELFCIFGIGDLNGLSGIRTQDQSVKSRVLYR